MPTLQELCLPLLSVWPIYLQRAKCVKSRETVFAGLEDVAYDKNVDLQSQLEHLSAISISSRDNFLVAI